MKGIVYILKPKGRSTMVYIINNKIDILNLQLFRPDPLTELKLGVKYNADIKFSRDRVSDVIIKLPKKSLRYKYV